MQEYHLLSLLRKESLNLSNAAKMRMDGLIKIIESLTPLIHRQFYNFPCDNCPMLQSSPVTHSSFATYQARKHQVRAIFSVQMGAKIP